MRHLKILETPSQTIERAQFGLRMGICRCCSARPPGSESLGADAPRSCESECKLFNQLPDLLDSANCMDPMLCSFHDVMDAHLRRLSTGDHVSTEGVLSISHQHPWLANKKAIIGVLQNLFHD